jgi:hypothetical protein
MCLPVIESIGLDSRPIMGAAQSEGRVLALLSWVVEFGGKLEAVQEVKRPISVTNASQTGGRPSHAEMP